MKFDKFSLLLVEIVIYYITVLVLIELILEITMNIILIGAIIITCVIFFIRIIKLIKKAYKIYKINDKKD